MSQGDGRNNQDLFDCGAGDGTERLEAERKIGR